jgi:secreted trypsin-like serine protease
MSRQIHSSRRLLFLLCLSLSAHLTCSSTVLQKKKQAQADDRLAIEKKAQQDEQAQQETKEFGTRIINGQVARVGRFDYFVRLIGVGGCGGALVAPDIVITAAHCKAEALLEKGEIGTYDVSNRQEGHPVRDIEEMFVHPSYTGEIPFNDIMVVKLTAPGKSSQVKRQLMSRFLLFVSSI